MEEMEKINKRIEEQSEKHKERLRKKYAIAREYGFSSRVAAAICHRTEEFIHEQGKKLQEQKGEK